MRRSVLTFLGIALIGYVGSYGIVRWKSVSFPIAGATTIALGFWQSDLDLVLSTEQIDRVYFEKIRSRVELLQRIYRPLTWLDEKITGDTFDMAVH